MKYEKGKGKQREMWTAGNKKVDEGRKRREEDTVLKKDIDG